MAELVIDYGLWDYHTPVERRLLLKQSRLAWHQLRRCPAPVELTLASCPAPVAGEMRSRGFEGEILEGRYPGEAVLLDPRARDTLQGFSPQGTYILGGMVDKSNRMRTQSLGYSCPRAALRLDGRASAVPDRLNLLAKIFCLNLQGTSLPEAIRRSRS